MEFASGGSGNGVGGHVAFTRSRVWHIVALGESMSGLLSIPNVKSKRQHPKLKTPEPLATQEPSQEIVRQRLEDTVQASAQARLGVLRLSGVEHPSRVKTDRIR